MAQIHNTNHVFTYIQKLRCCLHHWTPHTFCQESSNSYVPLMGFHSHYDNNMLHQVTRDTHKLHGHKSTMHPEKACYTWKQRHITFQLTHVCNRIFNFHLVALSLLPFTIDLFLHLHHQRTDILVTLRAIPSTVSWW